MLTARKAAPKACQSCRLHLLSIFENGFTNTAPHASRARYTTALRPRPQTLGARYGPAIRRFTASRQLSKDGEPQVPNAAANVPPLDFDLEEALGKLPPDQLLAEEYLVDEQASYRELETLEPTLPSGEETPESIVRQARQTFGETLPKDYLSAEEYILYERLYGPPLRETEADDLEYIHGGQDEVEDSKARNVLLRENAAGEFEEVEMDPGIDFSYTVTEDLGEGGLRFEVADGLEPGEEVEGSAMLDTTDLPADEEPNVNIQGKNQREIDAIKKLQKELAAVKAQPIEEPEEIEEEWEEEEEMEEEEEEYDENDAYLDSDTIRTHPHTLAARSGTFPTTISLPQQQFIAPISELLERTNLKHVSEAAEKAFGGPGLPFSSSTPSSKKHLPQNHIALDAAQHRMTEMEADAYMSAVMPGTYAMSMSTLVEVRKRLGTNWLRNILLRKGVGPRIMDAGAAGAGVVAWREMAQAEWDVMKEEGIVHQDSEAPIGKTTILTGADTLRHRISRFLENTTFLPRLPDYVHSSASEQHLDGATPQPRKHYDIIIAPHSLFHLKEEYRRKNVVQNLWSLLEPKGGVLILIEKGLPRGFEAVAGARSLLLERHIASPGDTTTENEIESPASNVTRFSEKEEGMIIAPCTTHTKCPMYLTPGLSSGRKDFCHFSQRFIRPPFLQRVLGASLRNHEDAKFSYLAVRRGIDLRKHKKTLLQGNEATDQAFEGYEEHDLPESENQDGIPTSDLKFHALSLPRAILPPLKRRGHVTLDLCTPAGKLERWTVPKSFSRRAYRDARKSKWGDLWALGAKTRVVRNPRLGRPAELDGRGGKMKGVRDGKMGKGGKKVKKDRFDVVMGPEGFRGIKEDRGVAKFVKREKRTKGGRVWKQPKAISEDDLG